MLHNLRKNNMMMEDGFVDIDALVNNYEYTEESPEEFEENFFANLNGENDD
jgi:hypothetical protein